MTDDRLDYLHAVGVAVADHLAEFGDEADWADARNVDALVDVVFETPVPMIVYCPACGAQHVDKLEPCNAEMCESGCAQPGECRAIDWRVEPHRSHLCHGCGHVWRPSDVPTVGVEALETRGTRDSPTRAPVRPVDRETFNRLSFDYALSLRQSGIPLLPDHTLKVGSVILAAMNHAAGVK